MKKTIAALMAALLLFGLAGCGNGGRNSASSGAPSSVPQAPTSAVSSAASESDILQPIEGSPNDEPDVGGDFHVDAIYGVFRNPETGEDDRQIIGQHNYYTQTTIEELVDNLTWFTGLDFAVVITEDDLGTAVEWLPEATLFDTETVTAYFFDEEGEKAPYTFENNNELRWFMLQSLAATINIYSIGLHYTMDGGQDLVLEGLTPVDTFPADSVYEGRP